MYTEEDFKRDYGFIEPGKHYWFPWEKEIIEELIDKEKGISNIQVQIKTFNNLFEEKHISKEVYQEKIKLLEQELLEIQNQET